MTALIRYFLERKLLVNLLTFSVLLLGIVNIFFLNREGYPQVDYGILHIRTSYPGAAPEDVELNVTIPIEEELETVDGIDEFYSVSYENFSEITVKIDLAFGDIEKIKSDIRRAVDSVQDLPLEVKDRPYISEQKISNFSVLQIGIFSDTLSESDLRRRVLDLKKRLQELPIVARVRTNGVRDREIHIKLDLDKMNRYEISLDEVIRSIKSHNIQLSGGTLESYISEKTIVTFSKFEDPFDVRDVIVRGTFEGVRVYLKDIADIEDSFEEEYTEVRFNGRKGMALNVVKKENSDVIKAVDSIKDAVEKYKSGLQDEDIGFAYLWDMSVETRDRLKIAQKNAILGLLLVVITLFIFLNSKNAFWTAMGLPFSFCFAIIFFPALGVTINNIALLGVIVVLGMVVDDAIIISENIYRHRLEGKAPLEAGLIATGEVALPVITTIATTVVAFLPMLFIEGEIGKFSKDIPKVVSLVLAGSLFESLFLLPSHVTSYSRTGKNKKMEEKRFIVRLKFMYSRLLDKILPKRYFTVLVFVLISVLIYVFIFRTMKFEMFPDVDSTNFWISGQTKEVKSLEYTTDLVAGIEDYIENTFEKDVIKSFQTSLGGSGHPENFGMNFYLTPSSKRDLTSDEIIDKIRDRFDSSGSFTSLHIEKDTGGPPTGRGLTIHIVGDDDKKRKKTADEIFAYLKGLEGVFDIDRSDEAEKREVRIKPLYSEVARYGVTALDIATVIRIAYDGYIVSDLQLKDELIEYRILLDEKYRRKLSTLNELKVLNKENRLVPISNMVKIEEGKTVTEFRHYKGDGVTSISADVDKEVITPAEIYSRIREDYKNFEEKNPGFRLFLGGEAEETAASIDSLLRALSVAVLGITVILLLFFKSFTKPLIVMFAIPFGLVGVVFAFFVHGISFSVMALLGVVGLSGVVVNDSLVMVEFINLIRNRDQGRPLIDIVKEGAVLRLRPILLTTITTAASVFPTAYGIGGVDIMIKPATFALFWGLIFATALTLILIPSLYIIEADIRGFFSAKFKPVKNI